MEAEGTELKRNAMEAMALQRSGRRGPTQGQNKQLRARLRDLIAFIYPDEDADALVQSVCDAFWPDNLKSRQRGRQPGNTLWSEADALVITYGNTFVDGMHKPLDLLGDFLHRYLTGTINGVHILPYFPFTSDDGFAVTDYRSVNSALGGWDDIRRIASDFTLMSDLVLNHVSSQSTWFNDYLQGHAPYTEFFVEAAPEDDLSQVVRPRAHDLLRPVETPRGTRHVWCTFSYDQVDLDFSNPEVLLEFIRIMRLHIDQGVRILRLDAVAFIWKEPGTPSIHMPQTHAIVRLMRALADYAVEPIVLLTETNVPNAENLSYFGNRNEAHAIYNFPLPPLLLHAMWTGSSELLNKWQMAMPPAPLGCAYLNFTASHDGIGVRGGEGLIGEGDLGRMTDTVQTFGGKVSMRAMPDGTRRPYELNITFYDAMKGTFAGEDQWQEERFLCSQTIQMALEGIPAFYVHSLLATHNDYAGYEKTGLNRALNRHRWDYNALRRLLDENDNEHARVLDRLSERIRIRCAQPAFHPNATQFTLQFGPKLFGFWRQSLDRDQSIFAIHNVSAEPVRMPVVAINMIGGHHWTDLLSGEAIRPHSGDITFQPYQCRWITNRA
ncbi:MULTISPECIES: sugar phosphorylase [unclassified Roseitalea]|uniref:sugar phosphorylase n=1 Tax=unclassified Roseitalea TaxID=2639107 RepID=UPI00273F36CA|nr:MULTISPECIES: sugar phosphorylase [unclassified Roseitalea]